MKQTDQTLLEQMRITELDIAERKALLYMTEADTQYLVKAKPFIEANVDDLVENFYQMQTNVLEISLLIGDADTLQRLTNSQRRYVLDLFSGMYDTEYVNNRLRIGLVHKRIGVEPKLYLSAITLLKSLLFTLLTDAIKDTAARQSTLVALDRLIFFDITLVFETYIRSLTSEIEISKQKSETYAQSLEQKVKERTRQLEELSRIDSLTGLLTVRYLRETLTGILRAAERRSEPVSVVYLDINRFKEINDTEGHQRGDEVLQSLGAAITGVSRSVDQCFRYGGDEFCLVLPNCNEQQAQETYIARLKQAFQEREENVSLSVGIVQTGPDRYLGPDALIHEADKRMYADKQANKSQGLS